MPETEPANFERDPNAEAHLAAQFGSGAGNAETLIEANLLRFSEEQLAANTLPLNEEATGELERSDVASAAGVDEELVLDHAVRGNYVTYVAVDPLSGRTYKSVLVRDGESLEQPESSKDPSRARLQAHLAAAGELEKAREEAKQIVLDAEAKAQEMLAEASQKQQEEAEEAGEKAAEERDKEADDDKPAASSVAKPAARRGGGSSS